MVPFGIELRRFGRAMEALWLAAVRRSVRRQVLAGDADLIEAISRHIERRVGKIAMVYHEIASDDLHIDVHHVASTWRRPFELLVTSGMSALPMRVPDDVESPFAEIAILLRRGWPISMEAFSDENNYWPLRLIKDLARFPTEQRTWLGFGHTVARDPLEPYAPGVPFCAALIVPSMTLSKKFFELERPAQPPVRFWAAVPLHRAELELATQEGSDSLLDRFDRAAVTDVVDPERASVA